LTQEALAGRVGVSRQTVSAIENGRAVPSVRLALALAGVLGLAVEQLFRAGPEPRREQGGARPEVS
jgi:DNA-binding XRE family transcriptional regulator